MGKPVRNLLLAFAVFNLLAIAAYRVMEEGQRRFHSDLYAQLDSLLLPGSPADILFVGSSRVHYGVNPLTAEIATGRSVLNAGFEGAKIHDMDAVLRAFLETHAAPRRVFIMIDPHSFLIRDSRTFNKVFLASYLENRVVRDALLQWEGPSVYLYRFIPYSILTAYDDYLRTCAWKGLFGGNSVDRSTQFAYKGYVSLHREFQPIRKREDFSSLIQPEGLAILEELVRHCHERGTRVTLLSGPYLSSYFEKHRLDLFYRDLRLVFESLGRDAFPDLGMNYAGETYFKDESHLNHRGADRYTIDLCRNLVVR